MSSVELDEWEKFDEHVTHFKKNGSKICAPYQQSNWEKPWWNILGLDIWMLGPSKEIADAEIRELHDASLVFL